MSYSQKYSAFLSPDSLKITKLKKTCQAKISQMRNKFSTNNISVIISAIIFFASLIFFSKTNEFDPKCTLHLRSLA